MSNFGWISLHRSMLDWEWYDDINVCRLFIHLLLKANHKDASWKGIDIKKGSLVVGRDSLSCATGLSVQQIRTALNKLKSTNEITIKTTNKNSLISITNWEKYQDSNQQTTSEITNHQPTSNQQITTNNNVITINNKNKEIKKDIESVSAKDVVALFNEKLTELPDVIKISASRNASIKKLSKDSLPTLAAWDEYFNLVSQSDFLMGRSKDFRCTFDWLLNTKNALKVAEGNYTNKTGKTNEPDYNSREYWQAIADG